MNRKIKYCFFLILLSQLLSANKIIIKPAIFSVYSTTGRDWMYQKKPINIFGFGLNAYIENDNLDLTLNYLQLGLLGNINQNLFNFSPQQSFAYIDKSKDASGYWTEHVEAKLSYNYGNIVIELGKFNRHWGHGERSLHISNKAPSYPQIGFRYKLNTTLNYLYFHGFLNSNIPDTIRTNYYSNHFSQRYINIPRNIAAHQIKWKPNNKILISLYESVVYATRSIDMYYLLPIIPFYPLENYIGDTDNIQMGFEILYTLNESQASYLAFYMDEFTPEWLFKTKNHNWFGLAAGYCVKNKILNKSELKLEYNWTDQRIYMHKYDINDFYNHQQPLGFWAGPHAQEFLVNYFVVLKDVLLNFHFSNTRRGLNTRDMVEENYKDLQSKRYELGMEKRIFSSLNLKIPSKIKGLKYSIDLNYTKFTNAGIDIINDDLFAGIDSKKISVDCGIFYNFTL